MKKLKEANLCITAGAMAILLCVLAVMPVYGMTPIVPYGAVPHFALYPAGGQSPLAVKSLDVTWQIEDLPVRFAYRDTTQYASFLEYQPRVQATYVFENPTDRIVTQGFYLAATLPPEYAEWESVSVASQLLEQYSITLDGKTVEPKVRYSYVYEAQECYRYAVYENDDTVQTLLARAVERLEGEALPADTPVTVYSYVPAKELKQNGGSEMLECRVQVEEGAPLVLIPEMFGSAVEQDAKSGKSYVTLAGYISYGEVVDVYAIGEGEVTVDLWKVGRVRGQEDMILHGTNKTTLGALAMQEYDPSSGISQKDWYSAVSAELQDRRIEQSNVISDYEGNGWNVKEQLQPMIYYEVEIAPHTTVQNTVELLAYPWQLPSDNSRGTLGVWTFVPPVPGAFASVGQIELHVHTSLYMSEVSNYHTHKIEEYVQTEQGYSMSISPDVPIVRFALSSKSNYGTLSMMINEIWGYLSIALMLLVFVGIPGGMISLIILLCECKSRQKREERKQAAKIENPSE